MKQPKKPQQTKFLVNNKEYVNQTEAFSEVETLKTARTPHIVFIDIKAKTQTTYTLNRNNYHVQATVYTPTPSNTSTANSGNDRNHANSVQNVQPATE